MGTGQGGPIPTDGGEILDRRLRAGGRWASESRHARQNRHGSGIGQAPIIHLGVRANPSAEWARIKSLEEGRTRGAALFRIESAKFG
jgi:hypothetical protein